MILDLFKKNHKTEREKFEEKKLKKGQTTFCYCPNCDNELISSNSFIKDTDFVYYKCSKCGYESKWDFDFLCPILIKEEKTNETIRRNKTRRNTNAR